MLRRLALSVAGGAVVTSAACASTPVPGPPVAAPTATTSAAPTTPPRLPAHSALAACAKPEDFVLDNASPAYAGNGPHPIAVADTTGEGPFAQTAERSAGSPRPEWAPTTTEFGNTVADRALVQLLVCVRGTANGSFGPASPKITCSFTRIGTIELTTVSGRYQVDVREARTGRVVGRFTVASATEGQPECPGVATSRSGVLIRKIDDGAFAAALRPYVEDPAR